jgi:ABC-type glutathione transport system ATPase component
VRAEAQRIVAEPSPKNYAVMVRKLRKSYLVSCSLKGGIKRAVRGVTLGIPPAECMGFLG